jgi:hypothetical protein
MKYRLANQFLEMWFQHLDSWLFFLARMEVSDEREIFIQITKETMESFISKITNLDNLNLNVDLNTIWEDESKYDN